MTTASAGVTRLRDRLREETAKAILAAAEEVFAEDGLHAARVEQIAARAGVAVGTVYNHFSDKEGLLGALSRTRCEALLDRADAALAAADGRPIEEQVRAFLDALVEHARAHGRFLSALVQAGEGPARMRPSSTLLDELQARAQRVVERGLASGELRDDGARLFAAGLVGIARASILLALQGRGSFDAYAPAVVELFLRGARA
ncbi:TetR/AcrR family transcriptional regulator [Anaeromyxobacter oryzae]|uniref:Transcriptional regulator n=1 Tax=Anaeromyxobacter oryzae TaxID=2918170 RepID=A0ABN6MZR0_9BACT|nr:TetR/AcrR family transcriptional regulator [Anaeromyxobacter oryzae]BDG06424.1 transcriptional regulator [Anaeromyxobacter oryzae]